MLSPVASMDSYPQSVVKTAPSSNIQQLCMLARYEMHIAVLYCTQLRRQTQMRRLDGASTVVALVLRIADGLSSSCVQQPGSQIECWGLIYASGHLVNPTVHCQLLNAVSGMLSPSALDPSTTPSTPRMRRRGTCELPPGAPQIWFLLGCRHPAIVSCRFRFHRSRHVAQPLPTRRR